MTIVRIFLCPKHIYVGHFDRGAGHDPMVEVECAELVAGRGVIGDRYTARAEGHKGQITFFAEETWHKLRDKLGVTDRGPEVFRRNLLVRGGDLNALIGAEFEIAGLRFQGTEYCKPCFWMDKAFAPGTLDALIGCSGGGLRARILTSGLIRSEQRVRSDPASLANKK